MPVDLSQPALAACALLFVQNTFSTLVISYSRLRPGPAYVGSVVVALGELIKIVLNLLCNLIIFGCAATREELRRVYCTEARQPRAYCPTLPLSLFPGTRPPLCSTHSPARSSGARTPPRRG